VIAPACRNVRRATKRDVASSERMIYGKI